MSSIAVRRAAPAAQINAQVNTAQVITLLSNTAQPCTVSASGKLSFEGKRFSVHAEGNALTAVGTTTLKVALLGALAIPATPLTAANWTTLGAGTTQAVPTTGCPWWIHADVILDSTSGLLQGNFAQLINNVWVAAAALSNPLTGINGTNQPVVQGGSTIQPADPVCYFALAATFSAAGLNVLNLANFEVGY